MRLDEYETLPSGMREYLNLYGWHFSKKMSEWSAKHMYKKQGSTKEYITPYTKETLYDVLKRASITLENENGYDAVYIANMCKSDYLGSSVPDEIRLARFVKDTIDDPDAYDGMPFTRFYADCIGKGVAIQWDDML